MLSLLAHRILNSIHIILNLYDHFIRGPCVEMIDIIITSLYSKFKLSLKKKGSWSINLIKIPPFLCGFLIVHDVELNSGLPLAFVVW